MKKRHFEALAAALYNLKQRPGSEDMWEALLHEMVDFCRTNSRMFNKERFEHQARYGHDLTPGCGPHSIA